MVTATQRQGPSACGAAVFAGLGLTFFKCQDKFIPPMVTAAGHGGPGSPVVFRALSQQGQSVRMDPKSHLTQSHQVDLYTRQHLGLHTDLQ